jgi:hypothetical protein
VIAAPLHLARLLEEAARTTRRAAPAGVDSCGQPMVTLRAAQVDALHSAAEQAIPSLDALRELLDAARAVKRDTRTHTVRRLSAALDAFGGAA